MLSSCVVRSEMFYLIYWNWKSVKKNCTQKKGHWNHWSCQKWSCSCSFQYHVTSIIPGHNSEYRSLKSPSAPLWWSSWPSPSTRPHLYFPGFVEAYILHLEAFRKALSFNKRRPGEACSRSSALQFSTFWPLGRIIEPRYGSGWLMRLSVDDLAPPHLQPWSGSQSWDEAFWSGTKSPYPHRCYRATRFDVRFWEMNHAPLNTSAGLQSSLYVCETWILTDWIKKVEVKLI